MNVIFTAVFLASAAVLCFAAPDKFLPALLNGARQAASSFVTLACIYAVWSGLSRVAEDAGISAAIAKRLRPACFKFFKTKSCRAADRASMNIACNMFGLGGAATPYGVAAAQAFDREGNLFGRNLLFILNACSVQIIPATTIALRAAAGGTSPADIFLPAVICTAVCTGTAVAAYFAANAACRSSSRRYS